MWAGIGAIGEGFHQGQMDDVALRAKNIDIQNAEMQQLGMEAYGRTMQQLFNIPMPGAAPVAPMPGAPSMPGGPQMGPMAGPAPMSPGGPPPPMMLGPQPGPAPQPMAPQNNFAGRFDAASPPPQMTGGPQMGPPPMAPGGPQGPMPPQQGMPGMGPQVTWQQAIQAVRAANPMLPPAAIGHAVDKFIPLMNSQSQQEWRMQRMLQQQENMELRREVADVRARQGDERLRQGDTRITNQATQADRRGDQRDTETENRNLRHDDNVKLQTRRMEIREELDKLKEEGRTKRAGMTDERIRELSATREARIRELREEDRNLKSQIATTNEEGRNDRFNRSETRKADQSILRNDQQIQKLELAKRALEERIRTTGNRELVVEWRAQLDAQRARARAIIDSSNLNVQMKPADKKKFLDTIEREYNEQIVRSKNGFRDQRPAETAPAATPPAATPAPAAPAPTGAKPVPTTSVTPAAGAIPVPPANAGDPDGTVYNGGKFIKRGNMMVPNG